MSFPVPVAGSSVRTTVTVASQQISLADPAGFYQFTTTVACYVAQGANPTASAANGSQIVGPNESLIVSAAQGAKLAVIRIGAVDGEATLTKVHFVSRA